MARQKNEILVEWLESKDAGERNRVNVKHVVGDAEGITVGVTVSVKFYSHRYKATVIDLLGWTVSKKRASANAKAQKPTKSTTKKVVSGGGNKVSADAGAVKEAKTRTRKRKSKETSLWLESGEPAKREKPGDKGEVSAEIDSVEEKEAPTMTLKEVTNNANSSRDSSDHMIASQFQLSRRRSPGSSQPSSRMHSSHHSSHLHSSHSQGPSCHSSYTHTQYASHTHSSSGYSHTNHYLYPPAPYSLPSHPPHYAPHSMYPHTPHCPYPPCPCPLYPHHTFHPPGPRPHPHHPSYPPFPRRPFPRQLQYEDHQPVDLHDILDTDGKIRQEVVSECRRAANSQVNLAVQLVKRCYNRYERATSNCAGIGKKQLSPTRMAAIEDAIYSIYPKQPDENEKDVWRLYKHAIDSSCRQLNRPLKKHMFR